MKNLNECINKLFSDNLCSNIAIKVGLREKTVYELYKSENSTINETTLFDIASVTKIVCTTTLALIAIDKKLLSPSDKVSKYFFVPNGKEDLSVLNLLTHTMGIGYKLLSDYTDTPDNIADAILNIPLDFPIGDDVRYSCPAFILLGKILEIVLDDKLDCLLAKYVSTPLEMSSTRFLPETSVNVVNANVNPSECGTVNDLNCRFLGGVSGNAGVFSNIRDLSKYSEMLLNKGAPIVSENTFTKATVNFTENKSESRGLGFLMVDERYNQTGNLFSNGSFGHCGHTGQSLFVDPQSGLYVIILSDMTLSTIKKFGVDTYGEVILARENIHNSILKDLGYFL